MSKDSAGSQKQQNGGSSNIDDGRAVQENISRHVRELVRHRFTAGVLKDLEGLVEAAANEGSSRGGRALSLLIACTSLSSTPPTPIASGVELESPKSSAF